ncbi:ferric reductase like transmembrane component-domain-containing protein, partial [Morchella snyderi]
FSRYIKYPALFGNRHSQPIGWYTFPTRLEALLVGVYWFINISFLFVKHGNADDGIDGSKILADRAGVLSLWNMPIFFLLAGRNDFLVWLTGWSYGTFHVFHKWVARVSALMGMVHSVAYAVYMYQIGDEARRWNPAYWWNGVSAMIVMGLILVLAIFPFRKKAYEFFLITHIIGVMVFLIFLYHHLKLSATRMYNPWLWACIAMWAFDRFTRLLRILILNYGAFSRNPQNHHMARAKFVKGTNVIQLTVYPSAEDVNYFPGAHYFVFLTGTWRFWESHPFTAAAWRPSGPMMPAYNSADIHKIKRSLSGSLKNSGRELEIKCLIEGAYGVNHPLHLYETVVLIAGGVGITTILPYLCDYMERARGSERTTMTQRLVFLWTAKEEELVENLVSKRFPRGCLTRRDISMQLYVTKMKQGQNKLLPGVKYMRPDIGEILRAEQARLVGKMSILSCGPSVLVDIVRTAVVDCLDKDRKHIEYFEESY